MLAFSAVSLIRLRLPAGNVNTSSVLHLSVSIRDRQDCLTEFPLSSVVVLTDSDEIDQFIVALQGSEPSSSNSLNANPLVRILSSGNQNAVGQVISSLAQQFNQINTDALRTAVESEFDPKVRVCRVSPLLCLRRHPIDQHRCVISG